MKDCEDSFFRLVRDFLTLFLPRQKCYSKNTIKSYAEAINLLRVFLEEQKKIPFTKITFGVIDHHLMRDFIDWLQYARKNSASTTNQRLAALKSFFKYAATEEPALMVNYVGLQKVPQKKTVKTPVKYLSEVALTTLFEQPDVSKFRGIRNRFLMIMLYDTAARIQELLDLKLKDLCLDSEVPYVYLTGKGQKTRSVPMLKKTIAHLDYYLDCYHPERNDSTDRFLFYTVIHNKICRMSEDNVAYFMKRYGEAARKLCPETPERVHPHLLRHTRAMHLYQSGVPLSYIKDILGHANVNTTDCYAFADTDIMRKALEKVSGSANMVNNDSKLIKDHEQLILKLCGLK